MQIIIVGAGKVGSSLTAQLIREHGYRSGAEAY